MHYYQFHVGDYAGHAAHLDEMEDLAYRRMLDYCYLNEIGLPESVEEISRLIRMRTHTESIANVLREFFYKDENGDWRNKRAESELNKYKAKSAKASESARKRWDNTDANALQTQTEGNANQEPRTKNQEPVTKEKSVKRKRSTEITFSDFLDQCKKSGGKAIQPDDPIFDYCEKSGICEDWLRAYWIEFSAEFKDRPERKQKDWRAQFRNYVRKNYYGLWFFPQGGGCELTSKGRQAMAAYGERS